MIEAMTKTAKVAIAKIIIRSKQSLAALRVKDQVLIMETIFWPDEIRSPSDLNLGLDRVKLHENEIKMAINLIENLSTSFEPTKYQNEYRQALWELIENKIVGKEVVTVAPAAERGNVVDLMEALKASVKLAEKIARLMRPRLNLRKPPGAGAKPRPEPNLPWQVLTV